MTLALDAYATDWLNLLFRWLHVIAVIAWIGSSFYFIGLDLHLRPPEKEEDEERGVGGEVWEIHGGGFYRVEKFKVAPQKLPEPLYWFKWEAYTTWTSGFALLIILYFFHAKAFLIDPTVADIPVWVAIVAAVGILAVSWLVYDIACRLIRDDRVLAVLLAGYIVLIAWADSRLFSARAAWVETGAAIGTMMVANVFFVIIPAHWELVRAKRAGRWPDPKWNLRGKQRSVHNNYLTLPVLLTMLSNHFPSIYGHSYSCLVLVALMAIGAWIRHFFNLRHKGESKWWILGTAAAAIALLAVLIRPTGGSSTPPSAAQIKEGKALYASAGCGSCHTLRDARATGNVGPNLDALKPPRDTVANQVANGGGAMPAFKGRLMQAQIDAIAAYVSAVAGR